VNELLANIVEAHGGFDRWRRFSRVAATIVTGGALWGMKNLTEDQAPRRMSVSLHEEVSSVAPFGDPDWVGAARPVFMLRVVSRLVRPEFLVVIEIVAAKA